MFIRNTIRSASLFALACGLSSFIFETTPTCCHAFQEDEIATAIRETMEVVGATAASITVTQGDKTLYDQAFGFADRRKKRATTTSDTFRIGSVTKPIIAAAIHTLVRNDQLKLASSVFEILDIEPHQNRLGDERIKEITIQHLLDHKGGWDHVNTFRPLFQLDETRTALEFKRRRNVKKEDIVKFMWTKELQFDPGDVRHYSNFGYLLLGLVIEKLTGKKLEAAIRSLIGEQIEIDDIELARTEPRFRPDSEVYYPTDSKLPMEIHEAASGLTASTPSLCRFMKHYWLNGEPRKPGSTDYYYHQTGSLPNTTSAFVEQRLDGVNIAVLLNSRRNDSYDQDNANLRQKVNEAIDHLLDN